MLSKEDWLMIKSQREKGVYISDIANRLGTHPKTVSRALKRGGPPSGKRPGARKSKLDPYKGLVDELLSDNVWKRWTPLVGQFGGDFKVERFIGHAASFPV